MAGKISTKLLTIALMLSVVLGFLILPSSGTRADDGSYWSIDKTSMSVVCGKTDKITVKDADLSDVKWKSSNTKIATVDSKGKITAKQAGKATITAAYYGDSRKCTVQVLYKDVTNSAEFWYKPTYELTNKGVVKGYDNQTKFKPGNKCTRAQMVTFIWRLMGEPAPKAKTCKFKDVKKSDYFYNACIWGSEKKIVEGYSDGTFGPQIVCARKHAVTFLWRLAGKPTPHNKKNKFKDVKKSDYFYDATIWAAERDIVAGYADGTFKPDGNCLRRQMVTFLYKYTQNKDKKPRDFGDDDTGTTTDENTILVLSTSNELGTIVKDYMEAHPDVAKKYKVKTKVVQDNGGAYQVALDAALTAGGSAAPDIYWVDSAYAVKYTQGDMAQFAAPYSKLGITNTEITNAQIAKYITDVGTRPSDGKIVGLGYQSNAGAFIYRRSIAKKVFGTDSPDKIASIIGPDWDNFMKAAAKLKNKGYVICSSVADVWEPINGSAKNPWVNKSGKLVIDSQREEYLDIAKKLVDNGYTNETTPWTEAWYCDMSGKGVKPCFGYFGPDWLLQYVIEPNCGSYVDGTLDKSQGTYGDWAVCKPTKDFFWGGTWLLVNKSVSGNKAKVIGDIIRYATLDTSKNGVQYGWATGTALTSDKKTAVASNVVMKNISGKNDFAGGQNTFKVFAAANSRSSGKNISPYDQTINGYWEDVVNNYAHGYMSRDDAINAFKRNMKDNFGF